jgi:hypothetical protein
VAVVEKIIGASAGVAPAASEHARPRAAADLAGLAVELVRNALVTALIVLIGTMPLVTLLAPSLADEPVLGLPLAVVLLAGAMVAFAMVAWLYGHRPKARRSEGAEPQAGCVQARLVR